MSLLAGLREQLSRYDEEAFVALANRGLLRRAEKDLEAQAPQLVEASPEAVVVSAGGQQVRFDERGPAQAVCSCPSTGVCQHILSACLWLQRSAASDGAGDPVEEASSDRHPRSGTNDPAAEPLEVLHAALLAFTPAELSKHASLPGYRWARDFVLDLDAERGVNITGGNHIVISFTMPRMTFRFLGGGLESLLCDAQVSKPEKYRVAAVLSYQRVHGIEPMAVATRGKAKPAGLDLGRDHALAEAPDEARKESRARLRASTRQLVAECVELGLSHLSQNIQERYSTLAVWAQGAEYYRMALLLRRIADHVELLLERAGAADEHRLFDELTLVYALVAALESADQRGDAAAHLVGRARNRYEAMGAIELLGLGAMPWRAPSGYIGLTMMFWSPADKAFLSCTDARPELQRGFNPVARYRSPGPWMGLSSPEQATGNLLRLADAQVSAAGRLSTVERTSATVEAISPEDVLRQLQPCSNWQELHERVDRTRHSLLSELQPMQDWVALQPRRWGAARFDTARQTLVWPLYDADGEMLSAEIVYSEYSQPAIARIEALDPHRVRAGAVVIARLRRGDAGLVAEPLSLIGADARSGVAPVDSLYFDPVPTESLAGKVLGQIKKKTTRSAQGAHARPSETDTPRALRELRAWSMRQAERGIGTGSEGLVQCELIAHAQRVRDAGFIGFPSTLSGQPPVHALLRMHYVQMQYARLLGSESEV